ncbi:Uncharacterised protein [Bordetella pertussis]|nr:Uncharacterised protein [Bordetella pertussis]CFT98780.1 Uncharacterised protein [Bordetella pertussis]
MPGKRSLMLGTPGMAATGRAVVTASARTLPCCTNAVPADVSTTMAVTWPPITSVSAWGLLL